MRALATLALLLAGCAAPDLGLPADPTITRGEYPALLPLDAVLGPEGQETRAAPAGDPGLEARAARLRARAAALGASALDDAERARIREALARMEAR